MRQRSARSTWVSHISTEYGPWSNYEFGMCDLLLFAEVIARLKTNSCLCWWVRLHLTVSQGNDSKCALSSYAIHIHSVCICDWSLQDIKVLLQDGILPSFGWSFTQHCLSTLCCCFLEMALHFYFTETLLRTCLNPLEVIVEDAEYCPLKMGQSTVVHAGVMTARLMLKRTTMIHCAGCVSIESHPGTSMTAWKKKVEIPNSRAKKAVLLAGHMTGWRQAR